jgi:periplasmic mercuric ion binding protein
MIFIDFQLNKLKLETMKNIFLILITVLSTKIAVSQVEEKIEIKGNTTEATFWVNGNCEMCKKRIEKALDVSGIKIATYTPENQTLFVAFNNKKIELSKIHQLIAEAGHDTHKVRASDAVYNKLHHCCSYERVPLKNQKP